LDKIGIFGNPFGKFSVWIIKLIGVVIIMFGVFGTTLVPHFVNK